MRPGPDLPLRSGRRATYSAIVGSRPELDAVLSRREGSPSVIATIPSL